MLCHTPRAAVLHAMPVEVSLNAQQYTSDGNIYSVYGQPIVSTLSPDRGPVHGGTRVRLSGSDFDGGTSDEYACKVGEVWLNATFVNPSLLECTTVALMEGEHCVAVVRTQRLNSGLVKGCWSR
jgi:hypothetical protein